MLHVIRIVRGLYTLYGPALPMAEEQLTVLKCEKICQIEPLKI